ncbi:hypothetical protein EIN_006080 [Entamoeba invadens IP1]|uniref:Flavodoxin-like domain-containing protein n=1 Tax=Entamoeba invadens IP1 TaxID=370355 RepID=A0A0A1UFV3_ENTIV|nr:hypothetical protein EIN_006080 [Entamoeba invadens IP1]ELP93677.1 hypothetical protein EIN_006080 [Entamoeba invadens IP1]|eukprot:XP_004260448.1 hypothetical protein EIN_006080 [Entamoeba invadens IP1]
MKEYVRGEKWRGAMEKKPLVVYYSNSNSVIGEIAHKIALDVRADIYEVKTTKRIKRPQLTQDGRKTFSNIPIVFDSIDFSPYNEIFIGGEWVERHLVGPMRSWINQNKTYILRDDVKLIFFVFDKQGKKINKAFKEMVELLGEPHRRLIITPLDYPYHSLPRKVGYHTSSSEQDEVYCDEKMSSDGVNVVEKISTKSCGPMQKQRVENFEQGIRIE